MDVLFEASHTHLYRGHDGRIDGAIPNGPSRALVAFTDGIVATATLAPRDAGGWDLAVRPHRTVAGADIPPGAGWWSSARSGARPASVSSAGSQTRPTGTVSG